jgi:antagonist of KipI
MSIDVLAGGTQTTVQDSGRVGQRALGVARSGAADATCFELANALVGNPPGAAALEFAWSGPRLRFSQPALIALTGAAMDARVDGTVVPPYRPVALAARSELQIGALTGGARGYLALAGGIDVAAVMGSAATDLVAGFGGVEGRPLRKGDRLHVASRTGREAADRLLAAAGNDRRGVCAASWWAQAPQHLPTPGIAVLRVLTGAHTAALERSSRNRLVESNWRVSQDTNRMGIRLEGPALALELSELVSEPIAIGTVQLPPNGAPIVLGVEAQTVGGYPRVAHVIAADWPRLGQLRPGDSVRFVWVEALAARAALDANRHYLARVCEALRGRRL